MSIQQEKFKAIADKIREKTASTELIKPNDFADMIDDVYTAGKDSQQSTIDNLQNQLDIANNLNSTLQNSWQTYHDEIDEIRDEIRNLNVAVSGDIEPLSDAIPEVYDAGKNFQNSELWKAITKKGERTDYAYAFQNHKWDKNNFLPAYDISPTTASYIFYKLDPGSNELQIDMEELEKTQGIKFDFSKCSYFSFAFAGGLFSILNVIDMSLPTNSTYVFYGAYTGRKLKRINRLIFSENTQPHTTWFGHSAVTHIGFEGTLAKNGLSLSDCIYLDKESIVRLINILSLNTSGLTVTLSKKAVNSAFGIDIDDETTYPEGSEYYTLRNTKSNWTFNYA